MILGSSFCLPSPATIQELFSVSRDAGIIPDISLDPVLTSFLSLDSAESLEHQYTSIQRALTEEQLAAFSHKLTSELGGSNRVSYGGVGVVALALSILIDLVAQQVKGQDSVAEELYGDRRQADMIFGISSSSRIGRIIHSYLRQIPGITNNTEKMAETTELYDNLLKLELIDHFERMTNKKKRMSSESMQQWLAGAAVHLHLRIHQVRQKSVPPGSAESLRLSYKTGFSRLVQGYTAYLRRNIRETAPSGTRRLRGRGTAGHNKSSANRTNISDTTGSTNMITANITSFNSSRSAQQDGPTRLNRNATAKVPPFVKTKHIHGFTRFNETKEIGKTTATTTVSSHTTGTTARVSALSSEERMFKEPAHQGLLVIEPLRNVSHGVRHHPCESPAIEQALVSRIIDAQDLDQNREFFLYSEKVFKGLVRQKDDFELNINFQ